ncbi:unnamed protein product [marine sediment metagenome]|uniref:Uncharacterized protein n=1 Tax=marine sediment metagenome TaxID=412755 RepID=X0T496_9ZZZZ
MANDYIPRPDAQFHAWRNNVGTYLNGHLADSGLATAVMGPRSGPRSASPKRDLALPPTDPSELSFLSVDVRAPCVVDYLAEDAGQTAHYMLHWGGTTGEKGPWNQTARSPVGRKMVHQDAGYAATRNRDVFG